jgi:hypothetical protein
MSVFSPKFAYWRKRPTLKVWFVAAMMHNVDPHAMTDAIDSNGDGLDLSDEMELIKSAALIGDITDFAHPGKLPDNETEVSRESLDPWLRAQGYAVLANKLRTTVKKSLHPKMLPNLPAPSPVPRFFAQEEAILVEIKKLGHDPLDLPRNPPGKRGIKAQVKDTLGGSGVWSGSTVFRKAWERLRAEKRIAEKS